MPRRYFTYDPEFTIFNQLSTVGAFTIALGFVITAINLLTSLKTGKPAGNNPWAALTLEWETQSPPITENFETTPTIKHGPYDYDTARGV